MELIADSVCVKVVSPTDIIYGIGNKLGYYYVNVHGETEEKRVPVVGVTDKYHGIGFRKIDRETFKIAAFAGRELVTLIIERNQLKYVRVIRPMQLCSMELFGDTTYCVRRMKVNEWISNILMYDNFYVCVVTAHNVALNYYVSAENYALIDKSNCADNSTIYCAKIVGNSWDNLLVFSGTAFGEVIIWKPGDKGAILNRLKAHKSSIFCIDCNLQNDLMTTTSDDRSVKFWKIDATENSFSLTESQYCFGHTARVFRCLIITDGDESYVASVGEDSYLCLWNTSGNLLYKCKVHFGATIWNLDYDPVTKTIFTCSSNGSVRKVSIKKILTDTDNDAHIIDVTPELNDEHICKIVFMGNGWLACITNKNYLMARKNDETFETVDRIKNIKCSILEATGDLIYVAGGVTINIYELEEEVFKKSVVTIEFNLEQFRGEDSVIMFSVIRSVHFTKAGDVIICGNNGRCLIYDKTLTTLKLCLLIPKSSERWLTSTLTYKDHILVSDRSGNLFLYNSTSIHPLFTLKHVHGHLGITSIVFDRVEGDKIFVNTTGHDGTLKTIVINVTTNSLHLWYTEKTSIAWIEKLVKTDEKNHLFGFNDYFFTIYEQSTDITVEVDCGGGHRYWDIKVHKDRNKVDFYFIKQKELNYMQLDLVPECDNVIETSTFQWHVKLCNVIKASNMGPYMHAVVSGGDDNLVKINVFHRSLHFVDQRFIYTHISNIKAIHLEDVPDNRLLIFTAGGRAQICVSSFCKETRQVKDEFNYMLKETDNERNRNDKKSNQEANCDPETRFMCMTFTEDNLLFVGCSDGFIRVFELILKDGAYTIVYRKEIYYGKCILNITHITKNFHDFILSMSTDGYVCFWIKSVLMSEAPLPFYKLLHHASGVNCFDTLKVDDHFYVATGGDDQNIAITKFDIQIEEDSITMSIHKTISNPSTHIAQITGIKFYSDRHLYSTSIDQKINNISFYKMRKIIVINTFLTCVSDIQGMVMLDAHTCIFYGAGYEVFTDLYKTKPHEEKEKRYLDVMK